MKLALYQFSPIFGDCRSNLINLCDKANSIDADIIVFPELALSGYFVVNSEQSAAMANECNRLNVYQEISSIAQSKNKIIVYGFPEISNGNIYNSAQIAFPNSNYDKIYRKTHLFYKERYAFSEGNSGFFVINYPDFDLNLGTMICYDWRFPESARSLALNGADLIVCPSNLVTNIWTKVMPARAIENQVYLAVANRIGTENENGETLLFNGLSAIHSYNGDELAMASADAEEVIIADINPQETRNKSFNSENNIFTDRRPNIYFK